MVKVVAETLKNTIEYSANSWATITLPKAPAITQIDLLLKLTVKTGTAAPSPAAHAPISLIKNINVVQGGKYPIQGTGWILFVKGYYENKGKVRKDPLTTATSTTQTVYAEIVIHPGLEPENKGDLSVALPTDVVEDTKLAVLWGDESDLGSGYTIDSAEIIVTVWKVINGRPWAIPAWNYDTKGIDAAYSDLAFTVQPPTGKFYTKAVIEVLDSGGADSDSVVEELGVVDKREETKILHRLSWLAEQRDDARRYNVDPLVGHVVFDAPELGTPVVLGVKDVVLGFTTTATGTINVLFNSFIKR